MRKSKGVLSIILFAVSALFLIASCSKRDIGALHPSKVFRDCQDCPEMVVIPPGSFTMGQSGGDSNNVHSVQINKAFAISKTEITRGQFDAFIAESGYSADSGCFTFEGTRPERRLERNWRNPGYPQKDDHPAACINWDDAKAYVSWLAKKSGKSYRLPSEAEWEYACRAGGEHDYCGSEEIDDVAWYRNNSSDGQTHFVRSSEPPRMPTRAELETPWNGGTHPVAGKQANAWGLYDMSGNVTEWTEDCWNSGFAGAPTNGSAWTSGECNRRVQRGGSWHDYKYGPKATERKQNVATIRISEYGFRTAMTLQ